MRKIPSLYMRDRSNPKVQTLVRDEVTPGCEWVLRGEGRATRKFDGTAVLVKDGVVYARFDAKHGKPAPADGIPCQEPDPETGHWPHWVHATRPEDTWIREAFKAYRMSGLSTGAAYEVVDGTYEACGPKINGNNEGLEAHVLIPHGAHEIGSSAWTPSVAGGSFESIKTFLAIFARIEGIVWHHPDGRMCKIKTKDFGLPWPKHPLEDSRGR